MRHSRAAIAGLALLLSWPSAFGQLGPEDTFDQDYLEPVEEQNRETRPLFRFAVVDEIPLPGPLAGSGPRRIRNGVELLVENGNAIASWSLAHGLEVGARDQAMADVEEPPFALSADGRYRSVPLESGWILTQKRCRRCKDGWKKRWKMRAPGSQFARPLITERRIYYGTTDNRVYCVKRRSGHRVWVSDIRARVLRPLELLKVVAPPDPRYMERTGSLTMDVVLVTPYSGAEIVALDGKNGDRLATFELPENESLVGGPIAADRRVIVAVQRYNADDAALLILQLDPVAPEEAQATRIAREGPGEEPMPELESPPD